jgi:hypothetical protein
LQLQNKREFRFLFWPYVISGAVAQVGTVDSVRGLPRELTEKLIRESLQEE